MTNDLGMEAVNYIEREDLVVDKVIITSEKITGWIKQGKNVAITGLPGTGKSTLARAVVASYMLKERKPAVILSVNSQHISDSGIEIINISNVPSQAKYVLVPVISVPSLSLDGEKLLGKVINALSSLRKKIEKVKQALEEIKTRTDNTTILTDFIKAQFESEFGIRTIPEALSNNVLNVIGILGEIFGYVGLALRIVDKILKKMKERKFQELKLQELLIAIDDLIDLGPNPHILSKLYDDKLHYLVVKRMDSISEYLRIASGATSINDDLKTMGVQITILKQILVSPPDFNIFNKIMQVNDFGDDFDESKIKDLWFYSGGFPAISLMMVYGKHPTNTLEVIFERVKKELRDRTNVYPWTSKDDIQMRWTYALYSAREVFREITERGRAYLALCCQPAGVAIDELAIYCGCRCARGEIFTLEDEYLFDVLTAILSGSRRTICPDSSNSNDDFKIYHTENSSDNGCDHDFDNKIVEELCFVTSIEYKRN